MPQRPETVARSGRRVGLYLAGSAALLLGTWLALRRDPAEPAASPAEPELVGGVQPASVDPVRRGADDPDPSETRVAAPVRPRFAPGPEHELPPERRAALANPGPQVIIDNSARAALDAARAAATAELQNILDNRRSALQRACGGKGHQDSVTLHVQASFGADGKLVSHIVDDRGLAPQIRECVQAQPIAMTIPPPGVEMSVRASLSLP